MPWGLKRYQNTGTLHFVTFSCYRRRPLLPNHGAAELFERALEQARLKYGFLVIAYVVMPEHVHLLVSEPERDTLATAIKAIKQSVARKQGGGRFWQERYYDFNVRTTEKRVEKVKYIHLNPVKRGLVDRRQDWPWSSYQHYATGEVGAVEITSPLSAWKLRQSGCEIKLRSPEK
jgi:putative transposase